MYAVCCRRSSIKLHRLPDFEWESWLDWSQEVWTGDNHLREQALSLELWKCGVFLVGPVQVVLLRRESKWHSFQDCLSSSQRRGSSRESRAELPGVLRSCGTWQLEMHTKYYAILMRVVMIKACIYSSLLTGISLFLISWLLVSLLSKKIDKDCDKFDEHGLVPGTLYKLWAKGIKSIMFYGPASN